MNGSKADDLWRGFLLTLPAGSGLPDRGYEASWSFGDGPEIADRLGGLVLAGRKTATCSALWDLESEGGPAPRPGEMSIVLDGRGGPLCVVVTTEVRRFDEVDEAFAWDGGEGDRSLAYWREAHRDFFAKTLPGTGRRFSEEMPLVCERLRVI